MRCIPAQLMWAVDMKDVKMMQSLIESGANVNSSSRKGTTAAIFALWNEDALALQLLVDSGADLTVRYCTPRFLWHIWEQGLKFSISYSYRSHGTVRVPLPTLFRIAGSRSQAAHLSARHVSRLFLHRRDTQFGFTLLMWAVQNGDLL